MIGIVDVSVQAHNVSMPLYPMRAFEGSPSSIRVRSVPKKIGSWQINKVYFAVAYPDNTTQTIECKLVGGVYVGTIAGCNTVGNVQNGYSIYADGVDENGNAVTNYCLGKGDIQILDARGITQPLQNTTFVQILSAHPASPNDGDMWQDDGSWYIWQNNQAQAIGDDSGLIESKLDFDISDVQPWEPGDYSKGDYCIDEGVYYKYIYDGTQYDGNEPKDNPNWLPCSFQLRLSDAQKSAIDSVVDERATVLVFEGEDERSFDWSGELTLAKIAEAGLYDPEEQVWTARLIRAKIGTDITSIGDWLFAGCIFLVSVTIPDSVMSIGAHAFEICHSLNNVTIPNSVTSIGYYAFCDCETISKMVIPSSVVSIGTYAFYGSTGLTSIVFEGKTIGMVGAMANYPWGISDPGNIITTYTPASQEWVNEQLTAKQDVLADEQVSAIDSVVDARTTKVKYQDNTTSSFNVVGELEHTSIPNISAVTEVDIGGGITSIGNSTFNGCYNLVRVSIPDSVTHIGNFAFWTCSSLVSVTIPDSVTSIGSAAFQRCLSLSSAHIGTGLTTAGNDTLFSACSSLVDIDIPYNITAINYGTFQGCHGLTNVTIPASVKSIGNTAFANCHGLTSITIPNSVTSIGYGAFSDCTALSSVTIPESVTSVSGIAFENCSSLTSIVVKGKTQAEAEAMLSTASVPAGCTITAWNVASQEWVKEYIAQYLQEHNT